MKCSLYSRVRSNLLLIIILLTFLVALYVLIFQHTIQMLDLRSSHPLPTPLWLVTPPEKVVSVILPDKPVIFKTDKRFLSFSIDSSQIHLGLESPSLLHRKLRRLVSELRGGYLRVGGPASDQLVFTPSNRSPPRQQFPLDGGSCSFNSLGCPSRPNQRKFSMDAPAWNELNGFATATGLKLLFDLNLLLRDGPAWNSSNAELLLDFSLARQYFVDWHLGNEPNSLKKWHNEEVPGEILASDYHALRELLNRYPLYRESVIAGPEVTSPLGDGEDDSPEDYLLSFLSSRPAPPVDAVSFHFYNTPGGATLEDYLDIKNYENLNDSCRVIFETVKKSKAPSKPIWLTESGSSYNGGARELSDRFVSSFLYVDRLGLAAKMGVSLVVRHSLYRGDYALIDSSSLTPNPDYWVSVLYKRLVGEGVLEVKLDTEGIGGRLRIYSHCSNESVILFGLNLDEASCGLQLAGLTTSSPVSQAHLYVLTAPHLRSNQVDLNGVRLLVGRDGALPPLRPLSVSLDWPVPLPPRSIFFLRLPQRHSSCHP